MHDIFISFNSADRTRAKAIGDWLRKQTREDGSPLSVFVDEWYLRPGQSWVEELRQNLDACRAVVVLLGPHGLGRWQKPEVEFSLNRRTREDDFPVIPVLLPGNDDPPTDFLTLQTWVDLRTDPENAGQLRILRAAIDRKPPAEADLLFNPSAEICPYRGLLPFREEDRRFFFGRGNEVKELIASVRNPANPVVGVIGRSGDGKSSLVYAGLIPELRKPEHGGPWEILSLRPRREPLVELMGAFSPPPEDASRAKRIAHANGEADLLRGGQIRLSQLADDILSESRGNKRLLVFVDQWEELYSQAERTGDKEQQKQIDADRRLFIDSLLEAAENADCTLVFTVRADFYDRILAHAALTDHLRRGRIDLGPMTDEQFRNCIERPAKEAGFSFEDGLVERIREDASEEPGALPLLEYLLQELWKNRDGRTLTHGGYEKAGGVSGAIAERAEAEYREVIEEGDDELTRAVRRVFVSLVTPGEGREDTRATVAMPSSEAERKVVERFSAADVRLITAGQESIEVSHEALIRQWRTLREDWLDENREILRVYHRIRDAMKVAVIEPEKASKEDGDEGKDAMEPDEETETEAEAVRFDDDRLLPSGKPLEEARDLLADPGDVLIDDVVPYIEASDAYHRRKANRARKRRGLVMAGMALLTVFAVAGLLFALYQKRDAQHSAGLAWWAKAQVTERADRRYPDALFYAARAVGIKGSELKFPRLLRQDSQSYQDAMRFLKETPAYLPIWNSPVREAPVTDVAISVDGRYIAVSFEDGVLTTWDMKDGKEALSERNEKNAFQQIAFSPDGHFLAAAGEGDTIQLWDVAAEFEEQPSLQADSSVTAIAFRPDRKVIAAALESGTIRRWDLSVEAQQEKKPAISADGENGDENDKVRLTALAYSSLGTLAAGSDDGAIRIWKFGREESAPAEPPEMKILGDRGTGVTSLAFTPGGSWLVSGSIDNRVMLWDLGKEDLAEVRSMGDPENLANKGSANEEKAVTSVDFSPDGRSFVCSSEHGSVHLWTLEAFQDPQKNFQASLHGHAPNSGVTAVAFGPDGRTLASGGEDGQVKIWYLPPEGTETGNPGRDHLSAYRNLGWYTINPATEILEATADHHADERFARVPAETLVTMWRTGMDEKKNSGEVFKFLLRAGNWRRVLQMVNHARSADPESAKTLLEAVRQEFSNRRGDWAMDQGDSWARYALEKEVRLAGLDPAVAAPSIEEREDFTNGIGIELVWCEPTQPDEIFRMGDESEGFQKVRLTRGFWIGRYEVTQAQWREVLGENPSDFTGVGAYAPVENVSWEMAMEFCEKLTARARLPVGLKFTLPTEAQWEYACRAGTKTVFSFGDSLNGKQANCDGNYPEGTLETGPDLGRTAPVGRYDPNPWGIHDMHGNVYEWCRDWYDGYEKNEVVVDPTGPPDGSYRVVRGGSWIYYARHCRSAFRDYREPDFRSHDVGFRLVLQTGPGPVPGGKGKKAPEAQPDRTAERSAPGGEG